MVAGWLVSLAVVAVLTAPAAAGAAVSHPELRRLDAELRSGRTAEVEAELNELLSQSGPDIELLLRLGNALSLQEKHAESEAAFREALELDPQEPRVLRDLGMLFLRQQRYDEALQYLQQSLEARDWQPESNFYIGVIHERRGDAEKAMDYYIQELNVNPASASAWRRYVLLKRGDRLTDKEVFPWGWLAVWLGVVAVCALLYWMKVTYWQLPESPGFPPLDPGRGGELLKTPPAD